MNYDSVTKREAEVLKLLDWQLVQVTIFQFLQSYLSQGLVLTTDAVSVMH